MSKEKRRVPKLRFPGFTEDWKPREFKNLFKKNLEKNNGKFKSNKTISIAKMAFNELGNGASEESLDNYKVLRIGDIAFEGHENKDFKFGRFVMNDIGNGIMSPRFTTLRPIVLLEIDFWKEYINYESIMQKKLVHSTKKGTMMHELVVDEFLKQTILVPPEKEQQHIGQLLKFLSKVISLQQRKLEHLNLKKKALLQKLFPKEGARYPELRFPGFTDAWEQCKLGEIFEYLQNNTLSRDSLNYKNPNIKNIHYGDILVKFDEILDGYNKDIPYINSEVDLSKFSKSLLRDGDIIFSDTAEDDTVGKAIELQNVNAPFILSGLHTIPCRPLILFGKGYLGNFLNSDSYRLQLRPLVQGIKVSSISKSALKDTMIEYPKNLDEQEKIGNLFYYIAKMITLHQRKLEHLQLQKKALLQQMFV